MTITYSRGRSLLDAQPEQRQAQDFGELVAALDRDRAPRKDTAGYICGPLNGTGHRRAEGALPRRWLAVDLDRVDADALPAVRMYFAQWSGVGWPTHSSTPEAPRERAIIELDRAADRAEAMAVGRKLASDLVEQFGPAVLVDPSTFRAEQPVFLPPEGVTLARFLGDPLDVDRYVASAPPSMQADLQKSTDDDFSHLLSSSVGPCSSVGASSSVGVPPDTIPAGPGERNRRLFDLARHVRRQLPDATPAQLREIALRWHALAVDRIDTKEPATTVIDFARGYAAVKFPHGALMDNIAAATAALELPPGITELGYGEAACRLVKLCMGLQAHAGAEPFFLSARQAAEVAGMHFTDCAKVLQLFVADGVLQLVSRGAGTKASRYLFVWPQAAAPEGRS